VEATVAWYYEVIDKIYGNLQKLPLNVIQKGWTFPVYNPFKLLFQCRRNCNEPLEWRIAAVATFLLQGQLNTVFTKAKMTVA
jgi:hypothetical protein